MFFSGCSFQNGLLYHPDTALPPMHSLKSHGFEPWPSRLENYRALLFENKGGTSKGTILVFHGNAGRAADRFFYGPVLSSQGYSILLAEYPGYGGRAGDPGEKAFVEDGVEILKQAALNCKGPIYLLGESLGCGVAAAVVRVSSVRIAGLILITPWDTLKAIAQEKFPLVPVGIFLTDTYDSISNLRDFKGPVAVIGAGEDEVIPVTHAENLYVSLPGKSKRMWKVQGAGHNNWMNFTDNAWWKEVMGLFAEANNPDG